MASQGTCDNKQWALATTDTTQLDVVEKKCNLPLENVIRTFGISMNNILRTFGISMENSFVTATSIGLALHRCLAEKLNLKQVCCLRPDFGITILGSEIDNVCFFYHILKVIYLDIFGNIGSYFLV